MIKYFYNFIIYFLSFNSQIVQIQIEQIQIDQND